MTLSDLVLPRVSYQLRHEQTAAMDIMVSTTFFLFFLREKSPRPHVSQPTRDSVVGPASSFRSWAIGPKKRRRAYRNRLGPFALAHVKVIEKWDPLKDVAMGRAVFLGD